MLKLVDLRSDTVTRPTPEMREAMYKAEVGDDVFGDDPTVKELEQLAAEMTGKESSLFVISGTMGNQIALKVHTNPTDEVILGLHSHIFNYEVGGLSFHSGAQPNPIEEVKGMLPLDEIDRRIRPDDLHFPRTSLICIENTHNFEGGRILPINYMKAVNRFSKDRHLAVHLDGARLFNAVIASGTSLKDFCSCADSVMFCLSKGLAAPIGSMICGSKAFITEARRIRKSFGGGMRQVGVIAAAGIVALQSMVDRLKNDHHRAQQLAVALSKLPELKIDPRSIETNIIFCEYLAKHLSISDFLLQLKQQKILCLQTGINKLRMVTHKDIADYDIDRVIGTINDIFTNSRKG